MINNPTTLSRDARKRLEVLQSLDDLGVGFKLALQDMEIRGAGNLLGKDQSGHINAIGYELYSRILKDAIEQLKVSNEPEAEEQIRIDPEIKIGFPTHIPPSYLPDVGQRLLLYQRLIEIESEEEILDISDEVQDRFGTPPPEVSSLFEYMAVRCFARRNLIEVVRRSDNGLLLQFHERCELDHSRVLELISTNAGLRITPTSAVILELDWSAIESPSEVYNLMRSMLSAIGLR